MAFQSAPGVAKVAVEGTYSSIPLVNTFHFRKADGYDEDDLLLLAGAVDLLVGTDLLPLLSASYSYVRTVVTGLEFINDVVAIVSNGAGPGTKTGAGLASNAAAVITHRSGLTGRSARGRTYFGGIAASDAQSSVLLSFTLMEALAAFCNDLRAAADAVGWTFGTLSRRTEKAARPTAVLFPTTTSVARNAYIDSQRGRLFDNH